MKTDQTQTVFWIDFKNWRRKDWTKNLLNAKLSLEIGFKILVLQTLVNIYFIVNRVC